MKQILGAFIAAALCVACTPEPETRTGIGVTDMLIVDAARSDLAQADISRRWMVRVLYPACGEGTPAAYIADPLLDFMKADGYYGLEENVIESWRQRKLGLQNAKPCAGNYPLATLSIGLGVTGPHYSLLAESLVDKGYVVAIINHPYGAPALLPDGTVQSAQADAAYARVDEDPALLSAWFADWARDISFSIDTLTSGDGVRGLKIDPDRIAASGHSIGGAAVLDACTADARLRACVNMDGGPFESRTMETGTAKNSYILLSNPLYTDDELIAKGRDPERWAAMGDQIAGSWLDLGDLSGHTPVVVRVAGTGHMSFSDAPLVMPTLITSFGGTPMQPDRALEVISGTLVAIMESHIGEDSNAFDAFVDATPELERAP